MPAKTNQTANGARFDKLLKDHYPDIKGQDLADMMGVHFTTITHWRTKGVPRDRADQVADLFGIEPRAIASKYNSDGTRTTKAFRMPTKKRSPISSKDTMRTSITIDGVKYIRADKLQELIT